MSQTPPEIRPYRDEFRRLLRERRAELLGAVSQRESELVALGEHVAPEVEEEGQEADLADRLALLDRRGREEIEAIDRALARIATDEFGYCRACDAPIPLERLRALPTAETCVACAEDGEARQRTRTLTPGSAGGRTL
jgi:DnaK suppressor protein